MATAGTPRPRRRSRPRSFERRLLVVLVLFSLVPTVLLLGLGAFLVSEAIYITGAPAAWERAADTGGSLIRAAEASRDPDLVAAAARHRDELSASLLQARRWEFLLTRAIAMLPVVTLVLAGLLGWLALRAARGMAHGLASPIRELVDWADRVGRDEPLPEPPGGDAAGRDEFGVLRDAFRRMSGELAASRQRALEAERMRTWVAMARRVAHELKNPLTPMRLAVRTLQRSDAESAPAEREALEVIAAEADRLDEMARAFAQFGRLPEGPRSEIDLPEMLEYLLRTHLPPGVEHRLLAPGDLPLLRGHHDALSRAFANLILNAADAVDPQSGEVDIHVGLLQEPRALEVRVIDNGPGIPEPELQRIWEPDFSTKARGTGLGLALVRQTAQAHGGAASARNRGGGGAEFRVVLPLDGSAAPGDERDAHERAHDASTVDRPGERPPARRGAGAARRSQPTSPAADG